MLVLTRKPSEMIRIGEDIFIKVIRTGAGSVKIGIEAPRSVRVLRAELCDDSRTARRGDQIDLGDLIDLGNLDFDVVTRHESDQFPQPLSA